ncbi:MAG: 50S ribosomal protein L25/general stress protein Ctc [Bacteroidales bacterium]|jgi:large subunit ribosomal protein L25|nr:50S ribosomal protein L25/general stress protein Ctc [Bacteroidales bacterium]MDD3273848.1 50S ribosomal protein L25/general stress protein Ctc [Bacteroidales bacterium]MDD4058858.1 50S ribosomal protein L25/general stress protein Ctc [Bacteroidales bacterium]
MKTIQLTGLARTISNKQAVKTLRREERVPCVLYGENIKENVIFSIDKKELGQIIYTPNSYIVELDVDGKKYLATFHSAQYHPVTDEPLHIDFLSIVEGKPVSINIPVVLQGNSEGVKQGGKLMQTTRKLKVSAMLDKLPDSLPVDITNLKLGKTIVAGELSYEGIQILTPKSAIICAVKMTRAAIGAAAAAAAAAAK